MMCIYIYQRFKRLQTYNPNGSILHKRRFNTTCYYKGIYVYNMLEKKGTHQASKKIQTAAQHTGNRQHALLNLRREKEKE